MKIENKTTDEWNNLLFYSKIELDMMENDLIRKKRDSYHSYSV